MTNWNEVKIKSAGFSKWAIFGLCFIIALMSGALFQVCTISMVWGIVPGFLLSFLAVPATLQIRELEKENFTNALHVIRLQKALEIERDVWSNMLSELARAAPDKATVQD